MVYIISSLLTLLLCYPISINCQPYHYDRRIVIRSKKSICRIFKVLCILPLFIVSALRYDVGTDFLWTYYKGYMRVTSGSDEDKFEIGYKTLIKLLNLISSSPQILIVASSLIFVGLTWVAIYEQSTDIAMSLILVIITRYYFISLNVIRQLMGMAIILYAMKYLYHGKRYQYLIFNLLAATLHNSLIIGCVYAFVDKINFSKKRFAYYLFSVFFIILLGEFGILKSIIKILLNNTKYERHLSNVNLFVGIKFFIFTACLNFIILLIFYFAERYQQKDIRYRIYFNIQSIVFAVCALMNVVPLMERIYWQFGFVQIISIPYIINMYEKRKTRQLLRFLIFGIFFVYCVYDIFVLKDHQVVPYKSIFTAN